MNKPASDLDELLEDVASVSFREACRLTPCCHTKGYELVNNGEWESYLDGTSRRVTLRSLKARRARLLAQNGPNSKLPPRHDGLPPSPRGRPRKQPTRPAESAEATT